MNTIIVDLETNVYMVSDASLDTSMWNSINISLYVFEYN